MDSRVLAILYYIRVPVGIKRTILLYHMFSPPLVLCILLPFQVFQVRHTHTRTHTEPGLDLAESL